MKTSVVGSLQAFIVARPPLVTFTLSVVSITVAIFLVAFTIKDKSLILDSHAQEDWNSFIKYLGNQTLCLNMSSVQLTSRASVPARKEHQTTPNSRTENATVLFAYAYNMSVEQSLLLKSGIGDNVADFAGTLSLEGWKKSCYHRSNLSSDKSHSVDFTLHIPSSSLGSTGNMSVCVYLNGPLSLLPASSSIISKQSVLHNQCQSPDVSEEVVGKLNLHGSAENGTCEPLNTLHLSYDSKILNPIIFLSEVDRLQIYSNLLLVGCLLLGAISMLLLAAIFQGRNLILIRQHSLIPTKETMMS